MILMGLARRLDDKINRQTKKGWLFTNENNNITKRKHQRQILCGKGTFKNTTNMNLLTTYLSRIVETFYVCIWLDISWSSIKHLRWYHIQGKFTVTKTDDDGMTEGW
jgi:hypothetical protein